MNVVDEAFNAAMAVKKHYIVAPVGAGARDIQVRIAKERGATVVASAPLKDWWSKETSLSVVTPTWVRRHPEFACNSLVVDELNQQQAAWVAPLVKATPEVSVRAVGGAGNIFILDYTELTY